MAVLEESRSIVRLLDKRNRLFLDDVSWDAYQAILDEIETEHRHLRHTYDRGKLEIMTRTLEHEAPKEMLGAMVVVLADELDKPLNLGGELTLMRKGVRRGIEPDQCYWIASAHLLRNRLDIDLEKDPSPDLFIEVEVSRTIINRLKVLAALRVPEVWRFDRKKVQVGVLRPDGKYKWGDESPSFPGIPIGELARFLLMAKTTDHMTILRKFRKWVREQIRKS